MILVPIDYFLVLLDIDACYKNKLYPNILAVNQGILPPDVMHDILINVRPKDTKEEVMKKVHDGK